MIADGPRIICRIEPFLDQGGTSVATGVASAPPLALGGSRGSRRAMATGQPDRGG
jgi:hypothetical protein